MHDYGDRIRRAREARDWTQEDLARESGVPKRTIQEIENGRVAKPQRATDLKLRGALDIEGDADRERSEWPEDIAAIVDIVGAYMLTLTPTERIQWVADFVKGAATRDESRD